VAEICQNRIADKDRFFRGPYVAQIEKYKTNKSLEITWGMRTRNRRSKRDTENFHKFLRYNAEICFRTATSPSLTFLQLEVLLGTKNEIKMIRRGHYSSNNLQDSKKEKVSKGKHWVISQECFSLTPLS
jgi:hypothetical protein